MNLQAGGRSGSHIVAALLATGEHVITALTRPESTSTFPTGLKIAKVDYADKRALTDALRGQDALVITLKNIAPPGTHDLLVEAAAAAGVPWIIPNHWSLDTTDTVDPTLTKDIRFFQGQLAQNKHIVDLGVSSYIAVSTGFWLEWSLAIPNSFGFDIKARKATFFDDGKTKHSVSTWQLVGRAVAALLSLPIAPEEGKVGFLSEYRNKEVYVASFTVSQEDMLESLLRVTGTIREEWTIDFESSKDRNARGIAIFQGGDRSGFALHLYSRVSYPEFEVANFEKHHALLNDILALPKENIDDATRVAVERANGNPYS